MSRPIDRTADGLREGHTDGACNFSQMRADDAVGAELAGGLSDAVEPWRPTGPDPFDLDDAYPQGNGEFGPKTSLDGRAIVVSPAAMVVHLLDGTY